MARWMILAGLLAVGCDDGGTDSDLDSDSASGTESDTEGTETETEPDDRAQVSGKVTDPSGKALQVMVNICQDSCYTERSAEDGTFTFRARFDPGDYWFYTINTAADSPLANMSLSINVGEQDKELAYDLIVPTLDTEKQLSASPAKVSLGAGLTATVGLDSVDLFDPEDKRSGGSRLDVEKLVDIPYPGEVVAAWYVKPFEAEAKDGKKIPAEITVDWGAKDGDKFDVYQGHYTWEKVGTYTVTGGKITIDDMHYLASVFVVPAK